MGFRKMARWIRDLSVLLSFLGALLGAFGYANGVKDLGSFMDSLARFSSRYQFCVNNPVQCSGRYLLNGNGEINVERVGSIREIVGLPEPPSGWNGGSDQGSLVNELPIASQEERIAGSFTMPDFLKIPGVEVPSVPFPTLPNTKPQSPSSNGGGGSAPAPPASQGGVIAANGQIVPPGKTFALPQRDELIGRINTIAIGEAEAVNFNREGDWKHWSPVPGEHGCTRREVELREAKRDGTMQKCKVVNGVWDKVFIANEQVSSSRGIDIDHIVPLSYTARHGGQRWDLGRKETYANDPDNLWAVDASQNRKKGDAGPSEYMPPNTAVHCAYAHTWAVVTLKYGLTITQADKAVLINAAQSCPA